MGRAWIRRGAVAVVALAGWLAVASAAGAAVRPADGEWQAHGALGPWSEAVYFTVAHHGTQVVQTNSLVGDPTNCGWAGAWADPPTVPISGGAFTAHDTGAAPTDPDQLTVTGTFTSRATATLTFTLTCVRSGSVITQTRAFTASTNAPPPAHCATARVRGDTLQLGGSGLATAHPKRFRRHAAVRITHRHADCAEVERVMDSVLRARDESAALAALGYVVSRVTRVRFHGLRAYRVRASQRIGVGASAGASIGYVRDGRLRIDHSIYRAGQQLIMELGPGRKTLAGCTAGFAVRDPVAGVLALTAGHCGPGGAQNVGLQVVRRWGPGTDKSELGRVVRSVEETSFDALESSIDALWGVAQQIERGEKPPLTVLGAADDAFIVRGTRVCFAGRTSGADNCGRITGSSDGLRCADVKARAGDSGGPVYTDPGRGLTTYAVGLVTTAHMCFTPVGSVLARFGAGFPPGPYVR